jgi:hypothetical protein
MSRGWAVSRSARIVACASLAAVALIPTSGMAQSGKAAASLPFVFRSTDVAPNGTMTLTQVYDGFGCTGQNVSPALQWSGVPAGAKSLAITVYDPDAPTGSGWWHWMVYDIPPTTTSLPAGVGARGKAPPPTGAQLGMGWPVPTGGRQAAPVHLHDLRAQGGQTRRAGDGHECADRLQPEWQRPRQGELHGAVRSLNRSRQRGAWTLRVSRAAYAPPARRSWR